MEITSDYVEDYNMDTFGTVSLLNPNGGGREGVHDVISEKCRFHIRGASSRFYDKKSYKLQLLNKKGDKKSKSLLGMRKDDDWVLNAMAFDPARTRYGFIDLLDTELLLNSLQNSSTKQLYITKDIFKKVYGFSNVRDFYESDLDIMKKLREEINRLVFEGINKPLAKNALVEYLDDIIKRLEK